MYGRPLDKGKGVFYGNHDEAKGHGDDLDDGELDNDGDE